jgi:RND family efflux transporter MFP subunit
MARWAELLAIAGALLVAGCGGDRTPTHAASARYAERFQVRAQTIADLKPVTATITSRDQAEARARIGGLLVSMSVKEGDIVHRGQLIGRVIDPQIGFQTQAYGAQIDAAAAESARAQAELARTRDLYVNGVYAKARLEQVTAQARAAAGALNAARAQRSASAAAGAEGAILAPADGRVLRADVPAGSVVTVGQSIATVTAGQSVIRVAVPEADAHGLAVGQTLSITPNALDPGLVTATVAQVYPAVVAGQVTADLTAPGLDRTLVGQRIGVNLPIGSRPALVVPRRFIVTRAGVDYAVVLAADGSSMEVPLQLAPGPTADTAEALSGLTAGDVLVRGASR